jgi:hypothetical protein
MRSPRHRADPERVAGAPRCSSVTAATHNHPLAVSVEPVARMPAGLHRIELRTLAVPAAVGRAQAIGAFSNCALT